MHHLRKKAPRHARRGAIIVFATICIVVVAAFLAFSFDYGYLVVTESELQNACDAGALSGARALKYDADAAIAAAKEWAAKNVAAGESVDLETDEDVELGTWDEETATFTLLPANKRDAANAVRVTCRRTSARGNPLTLFFAPIIGVGTADITVSAIAQHYGGSCGGIMALNRVYLREDSYTDSYNSRLAGYYDGPPGDNGDVCTNGHIRLLHNAGINGDAHPGPEETEVEMGDTNYVTGEISILEDYIDFPPVDLGNVPTSNNNAQIPLTANGKNAFVSGKFNLGGSPPTKTKKGEEPAPTGDPDSINLPPGTYYFSEMNVFNSSVVNITGPTYIYVNGDVNLTYGGIVNQTGIPKNLQIYTIGSAFWLPNDIDLHAVIYTTTSAIEKAGGSGGFFGKMVGQKIKINGSGGLHVDDSLIFDDLRSGGEQLGKRAGARLVY